MQTTTASFHHCLGLALPELVNGALRTPSYVELQHTELHGFTVTDCSMANRWDTSAPRDELIWVGCNGEGHWLKPEEALELAAALEATSHAHIERISREQRRVFAINHPGAGAVQ